MYVIYSKEQCTQCIMVKSMIGSLPHKVLMLDIDYTREDLENKCESAGVPMPRSFPVVFKEGKLIGGINEIKVLKARGEL